MENYADQLLAIIPAELPASREHIPFRDLVSLVSLKNNVAYEQGLRELANKLPYQTGHWPVFGEYAEDWHRVEVDEFQCQLLYCERGHCDLRHSGANLIELSYYIFDLISPGFTPSAVEIAKSLDRIQDQRLLLWLRMSSEIYQMFQVNTSFGTRTLYANVSWMCEELVRMGVFTNTTDAFNSKIHILKGLMLSGLPVEFAENLYQELKNAE
jgi:hypothetical protein